MKDGSLIAPLGARDRSAFSCGVVALDRYLREQASERVKRLMAGCFVLIEAATGAIAGYYTLAATGVPGSDLPAEALKRLPRYPILPAALVGRVAVDQRFQRKGLGSVLLADAALRVLNGDMKTFALIVDAKDEAAVAFYRREGFIPFASRPQSLFLSLATFKKAATEKPAG